MFRQLLWKEWRENLWKLSFCLVVSLAFTALLFRIRLFPDLANCLAISAVMVFVVPVVYALDLFAGEMSHRTAHLLFKIPVARQQIYFSKMAVALLGMAMIFLAVGLCMEVMGQGREVHVGMLLVTHICFGLCATVCLIWFTVFGCQNRSEAASLVAMTGVFVGWAIVFFWSSICEVRWATYTCPYSFFTCALLNLGAGPSKGYEWFKLPLFLLTQSTAVAVALTLACLRYTAIRRYL